MSKKVKQPDYFKQSVMLFLS